LLFTKTLKKGDLLTIGEIVQFIGINKNG